jgi:hypothetical protein
MSIIAYLKTVSGRSIPVEYNGLTTIGDVREYVATTMEWPVAQTRCVYAVVL